MVEGAGGAANGVAAEALGLAGEAAEGRVHVGVREGRHLLLVDGGMVCRWRRSWGLWRESIRVRVWREMVEGARWNFSGGEATAHSMLQMSANMFNGTEY